jgi:hypothetical protein
MSLVGILITFFLPIFLGFEIGTKRPILWSPLKIEIGKEPPVVWSLIGLWTLAVLGWPICGLVIYTILAPFCLLRSSIVNILRRSTYEATGQTAASPPHIATHRILSPHSSVTRSEISISDNPPEPVENVLEMRDMALTRIDEP